MEIRMNEIEPKFEGNHGWGTWNQLIIMTLLMLVRRIKHRHIWYCNMGRIVWLNVEIWLFWKLYNDLTLSYQVSDKDLAKWYENNAHKSSLT